MTKNNEQKFFRIKPDGRIELNGKEATDLIRMANFLRIYADFVHFVEDVQLKFVDSGQVIYTDSTGMPILQEDKKEEEKEEEVEEPVTVEVPNLGS